MHRFALSGAVVLATLALAPAASASALRLFVDPAAPGVGDTVTISAAALADAPSFVFVVVQPAAIPCADTVFQDALSGQLLSGPVGMAIPAGASSTQVAYTPQVAGDFLLCGFIADSAGLMPSTTTATPLTVAPAPTQQTTNPLNPPSLPGLPDTTDQPAPVETPRAPRVPRVPRIHSHIFGTFPLPISVGLGGKPANGDSNDPALSGDNRKTRLAAFDSDATNLVAGDSNGATDVFVWQRPRGRLGLVLNRLAGTVKRVSVGPGGRQANGASTHPSLDGSITKLPHCVAFQSTATNLAGADHDGTSDIYVRDLRSRQTILVSRGIGPAATDPSIDGGCKNVAFVAGGAVFVAPVRGGAPRRVSGGSQPDLSLDGSALVWTRGGSVFIRRLGHVTKVGPGSNPRVSDQESGIWGIVFDSKARLSKGDHDSLVDVYTRVVKRSGGPTRTDLISTAGGSNAWNGGITAYGANRGIIVFAINEGAGSGLWYRNNHTGNIDDLAYTVQGTIGQVATSARANFVAFTATEAISRLDHSTHQDVYFKHLVDGQSY